MTRVVISQKQARSLAIDAQFLNRRPGYVGKEGVAETIHSLGYIQIDPLSVIERAHHHTLWTRQPDYQPALLNEMQARDRSVFEYWGHAQSYIPMADFRFNLPRMRHFAACRNPWIDQLKTRGGDWLGAVLDTLRDLGPASTKDIAGQIGPGTELNAPADGIKAALDLLIGRGDVMICERRSLLKIFDLTERVLPSGTDTRLPEAGQVAHFYVKRALGAFGLAQEREIHLYMQPESIRDNHYQASSRADLSKALRELTESGLVRTVGIAGRDELTYYALSEFLSAAKSDTGASQIHLLSPFDNLIIQRDRVKTLFDFDYTLECYRPAAKRQFGYFVLPVLWGTTLAARADLKADRKVRQLLVLNLVFEAGLDDFSPLLSPLCQKLAALARFNQCDEILVDRVHPGKVKTALLEQIKAIND